MIYVKGKDTGTVEYFKRDEADKRGIRYVHWKLAAKPGQWLISDDDYVLKCTRIKDIVEVQYKPTGRTRTRRKIWTGLSQGFAHQKRLMLVAENIRCRDYGYAPRPWWERFDIKYPAIRSLLVKLVITGKLRFTKNRKYNWYEYREMLRMANKIFEPMKGMTAYNIKTYFGREEVRNLIREDIKAIAESKGITVDKVFDLLNEAIELGREKKDGKVLIAVAKEFGGIIGLTQLGGNGNGNGKQLPPPPDEEDATGTFDKVIAEDADAKA